MKLKARWMNGPLGFVAAHGVRAWMATMRYEAVLEDPDCDPARGVGGPKILVHWHEYLMTPFYLRANCNIAVLTSRHRDADILESITKYSGFACVRGSTNRGGTAALKELLERGRQQHMVITPDGPRGPRRQFAAGAVFLASKLGLPIVPIGFAYDSAWRMKSWDKFAIPKPFSTVRVNMGSAIYVPPKLSRPELEAQRIAIEAKLEQVTQVAESWAAERKSPPEAERVYRPRRLIVSTGEPPARQRAA